MNCEATVKTILINHIVSLFRNRAKLRGRRSFCAVIRQGGFKVVSPRDLCCCDIIILETTLTPDEKVSKQIVIKCVNKYIAWEMNF